MCFEKWDCFRKYYHNYPYSKIRFIISVVFLFVAKAFFSIGGKIYKINFSWESENKKNQYIALRGEYKKKEELDVSEEIMNNNNIKVEKWHQ